MVKSFLVDARKLAGFLDRLDREELAAHYLKGEGIEIGGLHLPLKLPAGARAKFVDRLPVEDLRKHYPELARERLVPVDIIDDGEKLSTIGTSSQDFVIANHFIEHCENPIDTLGNLMRVLKPGGMLFMAIPDKRYTFDIDRPITPFDHIVRDYRESPAWSREGHYDEWVRVVEKVEGDGPTAERKKTLMDMAYSIHFHVWTQKELVEMVLRLQEDFKFPWETEIILKGRGEVLMVLRKTS
jgi:SAM-dependent methyltransferase